MKCSATYLLPKRHLTFLAYKKELLEYGYKVEKISMKDQSIYFAKTGE